MPRKPLTLIIHGWSDTSRSFKDVKRLIERAGVSDATEIYYADYQSREDSVTFEDVVDGLQDQLVANGIVDADGAATRDLNVVVHSTGGLVIRHWLWRYYARDGRMDACPVRRVVMLAPANFGSPLAHRGKSFFGSLVKGRWRLDNWLETGRQLLHGLELASPYQWDLAHRDLFGPERLYGAGTSQIQCTVLVGANDYAGLRGLVNKPGTDGTVVISGCPLDARKLVLDCTGETKGLKKGDAYEWSEAPSAADIAFGVLDGADHGTIVDLAAPDSEHLVAELLPRALACDTAAQFRSLQQDLRHVTATTYLAHDAGSDDPKPRYQQLFMHAIDDHGAPVNDFALEYSVCAWSKVTAGLLGARLSAAEKRASDELQALLTAEGHQHSQSPAHRRFLVDVDAVRASLERAQGLLGGPVAVTLRVHAPDVDAGIHYATNQLRNIVIHPQGKSQPSLLFPNTTTLLELRLNRYNDYVRVGTTPNGF